MDEEYKDTMEEEHNKGMNDTVNLPQLPRYDNNYYLVIDSRATSLTLEDTDPKGTIHVTMKITENYHYDLD